MVGLRKHICLFLAFYAPLCAQAADERGLYQSLNYVSCRQYAEDRKLPPLTDRNAADQFYVSGWLTAYNYLTPNTYNIVPNHDVDAVMVWLDKFCKKNPDKGLEAGLLQYTSDHYPERMQNYVASPQAKPASKTSDKKADKK